jgi:hypothetical protein
MNLDVLSGIGQINALNPFLTKSNIFEPIVIKLEPRPDAAGSAEDFAAAQIMQTAFLICASSKF